MARYPVRGIGGEVLASEADLEARIREHASFPPFQRADEHPAQEYQRLMADDPGFAAAVCEAVTRMVRSESRAGALRMVNALGRDCGDTYRSAVLERLESGPALPDAPGLFTATVRDDLVLRLREIREPGLAARARALVDASFDPVDQLRMRIHEPDPSIAAIYRKALAAGGIPLPLVSSVAGILAADYPAEVLGAAAASRGESQSLREAFVEGITLIAPEWYDAHEAELMTALGL